MTGKHEAGTALQVGPGRSAFLAWCVCGWQGRSHLTDEDALHEAQAHVTERVREGFELLADLAQIPDTTREEVHHEEAQGRQEEGRHEGQVGDEPGTPPVLSEIGGVPGDWFEDDDA